MRSDVMRMNEERQQKLTRIIVLAMVVIGALGFLWFFAQGGELGGPDGILGLFSGLTGGPAESTP